MERETAALTVRQAEAGELDVVRSFSRLLDKEMERLLPAALRGQTGEWEEESYWDGILDGSAGFALLAQQGQETVGMALVTVKHESFFHLADLIVLPEHRGKGVGSRLLEEVKRRAVQQGSPCLTLHVLNGNERAGRLYESLGFAQWRTTMLCALSSTNKLPQSAAKKEEKLQ